MYIYIYDTIYQTLQMTYFHLTSWYKRSNWMVFIAKAWYKRILIKTIEKATPARDVFQLRFNSFGPTSDIGLNVFATQTRNNVNTLCAEYFLWNCGTKNAWVFESSRDNEIRQAFFHRQDTYPYISHSQYRYYWWPGNIRCQAIKSNDIELDLT